MPEMPQNPKTDDLEKLPSQPGAHDPKSFPDGGWEAWLVVSGAFCVMFCSFGWVNCIGVFQAYYQTNQLKHLSPSTVSWITSLEVFTMFVGGPVWGKIYDRYGPRYLLLVGTILHVLGLMMASLSWSYYQFILAQGLCSPLGASLVFYPAMSSVGTWFHKNRALAFGVMAAGSSLGGVIFPIMVDRLVDQLGFAWAMRISAFLILGLLVYANLTIKSRLRPTVRSWSIMEFVDPFRELPFVLVVVASFLFFFGMFLPFTFMILEAQYHGMSSDLAAYLISILNAASIFGRTIPGFIADRFGRFNTMIVTSYTSAILVLALWIPARGNTPLILFAAFYGFSSGAFVSLAPALIAQISDIRQIGVRTGTMFAVISIAALIGSPIGGVLNSAQGGSYLHLQIFCGVMMMAGSTVFILARSSLVGLKLAVKV